MILGKKTFPSKRHLENSVSSLILASLELKLYGLLIIVII